jgi:small GTP-binding protein
MLNLEPLQIQLQYKIVVLGDTGVGKTSLIRRYCYNEFKTDTQPTLGVNLYSHFLDINQNNKNSRVSLSIWDCGGQNKFKTYLMRYILGASGILFVFDLTSQKTLEDLFEWRQLALDLIGELPYYAIGTKRDLTLEKTNSNAINENIIKSYINHLNVLRYFESSAKEGYNIDVIFKQLVFDLVNKTS